MTFKDGGVAISTCGASGVVTLDGSGIATCTVTYASTAGSPHSITGHTAGDADYDTAAVNTVSETVNKGAATDTLTSSFKPTHGRDSSDLHSDRDRWRGHTDWQRDLQGRWSCDRYLSAPAGL